jgi:predicted nucleic acid-binding protein
VGDGLILGTTFLIDLEREAHGGLRDLPLVTRNARDFSRVPELELVSY